MTAQNKTTIKSYFETGDRPTQGEFADLVDSYQDAAANLGVLSSAATPGTVGLQLLSCLTSASAASIVGVQTLTTGVVGLQILATGTTAAAQQAIGGGVVGRQIYECATTAAVQSIVGAIAATSAVAFAATRSAGNYTATTAPIVYNNEDIDTSNAYNPATGVFTVPVTGAYQINMVGTISAGNASSLFCYIRKNATDVNYFGQAIQGTYAGGVTVIISANPSDTIDTRFEISTGTGSYNGAVAINNRFSGHLIR
jgi:hypothetical protein